MGPSLDRRNKPNTLSNPDLCSILTTQNDPSSLNPVLRLNQQEMNLKNLETEIIAN